MPAFSRDVHVWHARDPRGRGGDSARPASHLQGASGVRLRGHVRANDYVADCLTKIYKFSSSLLLAPTRLLRGPGAYIAWRNSCDLSQKRVVRARMSRNPFEHLCAAPFYTDGTVPGIVVPSFATLSAI